MVGINQYDDSSINSLTCSVSDVKSFYDIIVDKKRGGYSTENVKILVSDSTKHQLPNRSNVLSNVTSLVNSAGSEDSILFYFSGHGIEVDGKTYLLPKDTSANVCSETAIDIEWITKKLASSIARAKIVILDACHSGALVGKANSGLMTKKFYDTIFPASAGFATLASCQPNEVSWEWLEKNQSVFSYYLVEGLKGMADRDKDGKITITDANRYVSEKVRNWAFANNKQQTPNLRCTLSGDLLLVNVPTTSSQAIAPKLQPEKKVITQIRLSSAEISKVTSPFYNSIADAKEDMLDIYQENAARVCAVLLEFIKADEIKYDQEKFTYNFPTGKITLETSEFGRSAEIYYWLDVTFSYNEKTWDKVDAMISKLGSSAVLQFDDLNYYLKPKLEINEIYKRCIERKIEVSSYDPVNLGSLKVSATGWGCRKADVEFTNFGQVSRVKISTSSNIKPKKFDLKFYEVINPENILEFLNGCLSSRSS